MHDPDYTYDAYTVRMTRNETQGSSELTSVVFSVYDDGRDLRAFFQGDSDEVLEVGVVAFNGVESLAPSFSQAIPNPANGMRNFQLVNNPGRGELLLAIEATIKGLERHGYYVVRRVNSWH